ncbi:MAG: hypothetical protein HY782_10840 [Chloroflexi bacterium]|nr:hypothetical protein [Chloroflexota bacterium]
MLEWILFLPILFLPIGALVFALAAPRLSPHSRTWLALLLVAIVIGAILVNIAPINHYIVLSEWQLASFSLALQIDGVVLLLLLMIFVTLAALWLVAPPNAPFDLFSVLVLTAAMLLTLAANLVTVYFTWVLFDLSLFGWRLARDIERDAAVRALALSQIAGLAFFAGAAFATSGYPDQGVLVIAIALWARLGLFPFHWVYPLRGADSRDLWLARGVPLLAAASLWIRWPLLSLGAPGQLIAILAALALIASMIWVWREEQPARVVGVSAWHAVALVPLALAYGGDAGMAFALWLALGAAFAIALFEMALRWRGENRNRWSRLIWLVGLFALAGLPLTPAYLGRVGLYVSIWQSGNGWLIVVAAFVTTLALAPLWGFGLALGGAEPRDPKRSEYTGLGILLAAFAALSLAPMPLAQTLLPELGNSAQGAMLRVIWTDDGLGVIVGLVAAIVPLVASFFLRQPARRYQPQPGAFVPRLARAVDLSWLERALAGVGYEMGAAARNISTIAEENPAVWILLVALWIAILLVYPR